jgi:hypothetical protein
MSGVIETYFTVTVNGAPKLLSVADTTITTSAATTPRTWVKVSVNGRLLEAYVIDQSYEEALHRRNLACGK